MIPGLANPATQFLQQTNSNQLQRHKIFVLVRKEKGRRPLFKNTGQASGNNRSSRQLQRHQIRSDFIKPRQKAGFKKTSQASGNKRSSIQWYRYLSFITTHKETSQTTTAGFKNTRQASGNKRSSRQWQRHQTFISFWKEAGRRPASKIQDRRPVTRAAPDNYRDIKHVSPFEKKPSEGRLQKYKTGVR